jgi:hypothetical protein
MSRSTNLRPVVRLALFTLVATGLLALAAVAAEKVAPQGSGPAGSAPSVKLPTLPENAEEIEALKGQVTPGAAVTRRPARKLTPMMAEIFTYMEAREAALTARRQQLVAARADHATALALQLEMQKIKFDTEIEVLRIQARYATAEGRTADAQRIEASIEERLNPKVRIAPESRPVPSSTQR